MKCVGHDIGRYQGFGESYAHFVVGDAKGVTAEPLVVVLDGDVPALVEQWQDGCHRLCGCVEIVRASFYRIDISWLGIKLPQHFHEIGRRSRSEPVVIQLFVL